MLEKKVSKRIIGTALTALLCLPVTALTVQAEGPSTGSTGTKTSDVYGNLMNETGNITLEMKNDAGVVGGGEVAAYRVAEIQSGDHGYYFSYLSAFGEGKLEDPSQENLPTQLSERASSVKADASTAVGSDGVAKFAGLKTGVYLIVQTKAADGYYAVKPFLVTLPESMDANDAAQINLDVVATPKVSPVEKIPTPKPNKPQKELVDTGLLYWPIGVLLAGGIALCVAGAVRRRKAVNG